MKELLVIKLGGNVIEDDRELGVFLERFAALPQLKILVHGGGSLASELAGRLGIKQHMLQGRRITDAETLKIVTMVYAGWINKTLVAGLQKAGCTAIGLAGMDGNLLLAHRRKTGKTDYGFVGDIDRVNGLLLQHLLEVGLTPVIAPVTHDGQGQLLNTNADTVAREIARECSREYNTRLLYLFDKPGVLREAGNAHSVIETIHASGFEALKTEQVIAGGMIPKLENAFEALRAGVARVTLGRAGDLQALLEGHAGTTLTNE